MKIEAGKLYRTRDGRKVWVIATATPAEVGAVLQPVVGWIAGRGVVDTWSTAGEYAHTGTEDRADLVAEWVEQIEVERWVLVCARSHAGYSQGQEMIHAYSSLEMAEDAQCRRVEPDAWEVVRLTGKTGKTEP